MTKILIVGDNCIDTYWIGTASGMSAEAPVPVIKQTRMQVFPGMAGNIQSLIQVIAPTIETSLLIGPNPHLPIKNRLMTESGDQIARWDIEDFCTPLTIEDFEGQCSGVTAIIVADYGKGAITPGVIKHLSGLAEWGIPLMIDTKNDPFQWVGIPNVTLFPNGKEWDTWRSHYEWMPSVIHKLSGDGARQVAYGKTIHRSPARCHSPRNVCGAGDAVIAAYIVASTWGWDRDACLNFSQEVAGRLVAAPFDCRYTSLAPEERLAV